jgi:hypothetical protein
MIDLQPVSVPDLSKERVAIRTLHCLVAGESGHCLGCSHVCERSLDPDPGHTAIIWFSERDRVPHRHLRRAVTTS